MTPPSLISRTCPASSGPARAGLGLLVAWLGLLSVAQRATAGEAPLRLDRPLLHLDEALATARVQQPSVRQQQAETEAALARVGQARAQLLPQLNGTLGYSRSTGNFAGRPGAIPGSAQAGSASLDSFDFWSTGLTVNQLLYDSQVTIDRFFAQRRAAEAQAATEQSTLLGVELGVRRAFFTARAQRALVEVARQTLTNEERHLAQVTGFVEVGTRPEVDLAQARTTRAQARLALIQAENAYATARTALLVAMGVSGDSRFEVADDGQPPIADEGAPLEQLVLEARGQRPELVALGRQLKSQEATLRSTLGGYGPSLSASLSLTDAGRSLGSMVWNWSFGVQLGWNLFSGLATWEAVKEQRARIRAVEASRTAAEQKVHQEVETAQLGIAASLAAVEAADEARRNAEARFRLATERYRIGVGSAIEQADAQLMLSTAEAQAVQAAFNLASARAQLLFALGRAGR